MRKAAGGNEGFLAPLVDEGRGKGIRFFDLPMKMNIVLFLIMASVQMCLHVDLFASQGGIFQKGDLVSGMAVGASIVILAYLCLSAPWNGRRAAKGNLRQKLNMTLLWFLFAAFVLVNIAWLAQLYPDLHPARVKGGILLLLFFLLFASPIYDGIPMLRDMPNNHWLYTISTSLSTFVLFIANPIGLYVSSGDFVGGVYSVAGTFLLFFTATFLALTALYLFVGEPARKALTLLSVFSAVSVIAYSTMGVKDGGLMSQFVLPFPKGLVRTSYEIVVEIVTLLVVLGTTSYATTKYRQNVTYIVGAMLITSIGMTAADIRGAKGDIVAASKQLPVDHVDIVSFSRERNILIIMLDGFPGGYLHKILDEVPEALKEYGGFTWYPNTVTASNYTLGAIATLVGGPRYGVHEINSRNYDSLGSAINESYSVYIDAFVSKDYQVTYVNPAYAGGCDRLDKRIHCVDTLPYGTYYRDKEEPHAPLLQGDHAPFILVMVSLLKALPLFLKSWIYDDGSYLGANSTLIKHAGANTSKAREWGFLHVLARESNADSTSKTFKFIQLSIPHGPNALNHDCKLQQDKSTVLTESVCALKEIGVLLTWMKEARIYDTSKIVVVSDHGWYVDNPMFPHDFEKALPKLDGWLSMPGFVQPLLLVKDFDDRGDLRQSDTFLSNSDVPSIVCGAAGGCRDVGPDPIANSLESRKLVFAMTAFPKAEDKAKQFDIKASFEVRNNIFRPENWTRIK